MRRTINALPRYLQRRAMSSVLASNPPTVDSGFDALEANLRLLSKPGGRADTTRLGKLLDGLIQCSDPRKTRLCKDACRIAHAAGLHVQCAEFFFSCRCMGPVSLDDVVVNAAACTWSPEYLKKCLPTAEGDSAMHGTSSHETLAALRIFWQSTRCFLKLERGFKDVGAKCKVSLSHHAGGGELEQLVQYRAISDEAFRFLKLPDGATFSDWWSKSKRLVLYHQEDDGEAAVYEHYFSFWQRHLGQKLLSWVDAPCLVAMLRSCMKAERWDLTNHYLEVASDYLISRASAPEDALLQQCVTVFGASTQTKAGVAWFKRVRDAYRNHIPSATVVHGAARLAGDAEDEELALWCLHSLLSERQQASPSQRDIFPCLAALAKCKAKDFKKLLRMLEEAGLVKYSDENWLYLELLRSRHSLFAWEELLQRIDEHLTHANESLARVGLSLRNVGLFLRMLQETEHIKFMEYYRAVKREFQADALDSTKAQWLATALKWALTQCTLKYSDYELLTRESHALLGNGKLVDAGHSVISRSLSAKICSRLLAVHQLVGKEPPADGPMPHRGVVSAPILRFTRQRRLLPRSPPPWMEVDGPPKQRELWGVPSTLQALSQHEWRKFVQRW